jgi:hypothetical protein
MQPKISLEGSSRPCHCRDGGWDARGVLATRQASCHPGRERGKVMKLLISRLAVGDFEKIMSPVRSDTRESGPDNGMDGWGWPGFEPVSDKAEPVQCRSVS